jgi:hypothetical protein
LEVENVHLPLDGEHELVKHGCRYEIGGQEDINKKKHEIFAVPEANAVVNPGAVMVHVENATIAGRAVMASLRLEHVAHQAVASALIFSVAQVESPENRHLSRVCGHRLEE